MGRFSGNIEIMTPRSFYSYLKSLADNTVRANKLFKKEGDIAPDILLPTLTLMLIRELDIEDIDDDLLKRFDDYIHLVSNQEGLSFYNQSGVGGYLSISILSALTILINKNKNTEIKTIDGLITAFLNEEEADKEMLTELHNFLENYEPDPEIEAKYWHNLSDEERRIILIEELADELFSKNEASFSFQGSCDFIGEVIAKQKEHENIELGTISEIFNAINQKIQQNPYATDDEKAKFSTSINILTTDSNQDLETTYKEVSGLYREIKLREKDIIHFCLDDFEQKLTRITDRIIKAEKIVHVDIDTLSQKLETAMNLASVIKDSYQNESVDSWLPNLKKLKDIEKDINELFERFKNYESFQAAEQLKDKLYHLEKDIGNFSNYQVQGGKAEDLSLNFKPAAKFLQGIGCTLPEDDGLTQGPSEAELGEVNINAFNDDSNQADLTITPDRIQELKESAKIYENTDILPEFQYLDNLETHSHQESTKEESSQYHWQNLAVGVCHAQKIDVLIDHHKNKEGKAIAVPKSGRIEAGANGITLLSTPALNFAYGHAKSLGHHKDRFIEGMFHNIFNAAVKEGCDYITLPAAGLGVFGGEPNDYFKALKKVAQLYPQLNIIYHPGRYSQAFEQVFSEKIPNVVKATKDVFYLANQLSELGEKVAYHNPSDADVVYGVNDVGEYWKHGTGDRFVAEEFIASVTTAPLNSKGINPEAYHTIEERSCKQVFIPNFQVTLNPLEAGLLDEAITRYNNRFQSASVKEKKRFFNKLVNSQVNSLASLCHELFELTKNQRQRLFKSKMGQSRLDSYASVKIKELLTNYGVVNNEELDAALRQYLSGDDNELTRVLTESPYYQNLQKLAVKIIYTPEKITGEEFNFLAIQDSLADLFIHLNKISPHDSFMVNMQNFLNRANLVLDEDNYAKLVSKILNDPANNELLIKSLTQLPLDDDSVPSMPPSFVADSNAAKNKVIQLHRENFKIIKGSEPDKFNTEFILLESREGGKLSDRDYRGDIAIFNEMALLQTLLAASSKSLTVQQRNMVKQCYSDIMDQYQNYLNDESYPPDKIPFLTNTAYGKAIRRSLNQYKEQINKVSDQLQNDCLDISGLATKALLHLQIASDYSSNNASQIIKSLLSLRDNDMSEKYVKKIRAALKSYINGSLSVNELEVKFKPELEPSSSYEKINATEGFKRDQSIVIKYNRTSDKEQLDKQDKKDREFDTNNGDEMSPEDDTSNKNRPN